MSLYFITAFHCFLIILWCAQMPIWRFLCESEVYKQFQDYNNKLAQLRAGKSSKSKLLLAKFKSKDSLNGWDVHQGTYFQDVVAAKYDGGMDAKFEFTESGLAIFSGNMMEPWLNSSLHIRFTGGLQRLFSEYSE